MIIDATDPTHPAATLDGHPIDATTAAVLCCDPRIHPLHTDADRHPLDLGRAVRYATEHQRRAAAVRDGGCCFPGCDQPITWCDLHHIHHWHAGGPTDLANLIHLCRHHHTITHRPDWHLHTTTKPHTSHTHHRWTTPTGTTLWAQRHHTPNPNPRAGPDGEGNPTNGDGDSVSDPRAGPDPP
ncbi:MAG: HNH endonuclease [Acidimicrobiia bacterium]|nr:HNH endonuclease [Acidimicrobiia bacterium]